MLTDGFSLEFDWQFDWQVSRTLLRILAVHSNAVVFIVSNRPLTSKSSSPLVIVPKALITIGTIVTFMFHIVFNSLARSKYLSFFSFSFRFILWSAGTAKSTILQILFFFVGLLLLFYFLGVCVIWGSFTGVWATANLLKCPGFFSVFWLISIMVESA